jgi:transcriptional regulator GlxA family with amidase domain
MVPGEVTGIHLMLNQLLTRPADAPRWVDLENGLGLSSRTIRRHIKSHVDWFGRVNDFKAQIQYWRLTTASMLLSTRQNRVVEVARLMGYGTARALLRAMDDYALPPPRTIRSALDKVESDEEIESL